MENREEKHVTKEEVWAAFAETDRELKELKAVIAENARAAEKRAQEAAAEAEKRAQEAAAAAEKRAQDWEAAAAKRAQEAEKRTQEWEKRDAKLEKKLAHVSDLVGRMGNNDGEIAEEYFANALEEKKVFAGQRFDDIDRNIKGHDGKVRDEFDIVLYNGTSVALIEVKHKIHLNDVDKMVTQKVPNFRFLFPRYKGYKIYLGIASLAFYDDVEDRAKALGIGILKQKGDVLETDTAHVRAY